LERGFWWQWIGGKPDEGRSGEREGEVDSMQRLRRKNEVNAGSEPNGAVMCFQQWGGSALRAENPRNCAAVSLLAGLNCRDLGCTFSTFERVHD
jgi:hypothetical protein